MGRSLTNTMCNIGIQSACDEAMYQVGNKHPLPLIGPINLGAATQCRDLPL